MQNKRGIGNLQIIGGSILAVVILAVIITFMISSRFRWFVLGVALIVGAGYLVLQTDNKRLRTVVIIIGLLAGVGFVIGSGVLQSFTGAVYLPEYASVWCGVCDSGEQNSIDNIDVGFFGEEFKQYSCEGGYIPKGCNFEVEVKGGSGETGLYYCNPEVSKSTVKTELEREITPFKNGGAISGCERLGDSQLPSDNVRRFTVPQNHKVYVMTEQDMEIAYNYDPFCLRTLERGQLSTFSTCSRSQLSSKTKDIPNNLPSILDPTTYGRQNSIENIVIGFSEVVNSINVVENGDKFLKRGLSGDIEACKINTADRGEKYVDLTSCKTDSNYVCLPSTPPQGFLCEDGTELVEISKDAECSGSGLTGERIVDGEKCELFCTNGKQEIKNCEKIIGEDEGKVDPIPLEEALEVVPVWVYWVIGSLILVILGALIYLALPKEKK